MRKSPFFAVILAAFVLTPSLVEARGGGGLEYLTNIGSDAIPQLQSTGGRLLDLPTGTISAISGFGYGVLPGGWKIGGFGIFFYSGELSLTIPNLGGPLTRAVGGAGGLISGGYARWGPFGFSLDIRIGAGGMGVSYLGAYSSEFGPMEATDGVFVLYGALKGEIGTIMVPAMMVSLFTVLMSLRQSA